MNSDAVLAWTERDRSRSRHQTSDIRHVVTVN